MLRRMLLVFGLCVLASASVRAQEEKVELFGGYSFLHFHASPSTNLNGWEASGQYKFTDWLGHIDLHVPFRATNLLPLAGIPVCALAARRGT